MRKLFVFLTAFICFFQASEGITSLVYYEDMAVTLTQMVKSADDVIVVKPSDKWEVYLEQKIPQKPGLPPPEEVYREHVYFYDVVSVLESKTIKPGQVIKVWDAPTFSYEEMKASYERGLRRSPIIQVYRPVHEPVEGENFILLLQDKEPEKSVYRRTAEEGLTTQPEIEKILKTQP